MTTTPDAAVTELTKKINDFCRPHEQAAITKAIKLTTEYLDAHPHLDRSDVIRRVTDTWCDGDDDAKSFRFVNAFYSLAERS